MTPHISRRTTVSIATAVAAGALLTGALTATGAAAQPSAPSATPLALSASARADLIKDARANTAETAQELKLGSKEKLVVRDVVKDRDGTTHTRYERTYDGLPVLGGDLVVHASKSGEREGVTRATSKSIDVATTGASLAAAPSGARKIVWAATGTPRLAYEKVVKSTKKDGTPSRLHVITDAATGKKITQFDAIMTGTGTSEYSGTVEIGTTKSGSSYALTDGTRGGHSTYNLNHGTSGKGTLFTDADDKWGDGTVNDPATAGVDAAYGAQVTWDFYKNVFGRSGINGDGKGAYSRVHYGNAYVNAFWDDSCFCMTYGDGSGNKDPLTAIDVAAHEMSHGVTSATAGLIYSGESGGLNEATSDIFGTSVEFYANNSADPGDYLIGEKIDINGDGSPLRYMDKPSKDGASLDSWKSGAGNVDVHYSSGIANHFFYLLSEGSGKKTINGVAYDSPTADGSTVTGIGRDKAEQIWFKALTTYFTSSTNYAKARTATLSAASDLYGASSAEYKAVAAAWTAVNVK
ncbi:M4 family metallopeptidase [Streptomyces sp. VRA16 Mangrove soil]|uniref:M4 family metallopeptidase n=1 Tax=Streptomyces sp. VRA16 Mangrove soil TaxID=2817434 RepID=UPI001A9FCFC3|nr:M4 family metallopeptidase [Streptomyces sp. VRA16 Mangrove soil]MBO1336442.1 M4 family metallopeptidase [Streptomyces sp. VRA16 Mangrove soil]